MTQKFYRRLYTVKECYHILDDAMGSMKYIKKAKRDKLIDNAFQERILLAVTEVNGCEMCCYKHTGDALKNGVSDDEIKALLAGDLSGMPEEESVAIYFAQHYADKRGHPDKENWDCLISTYGEEKALGILGLIRMIMLGNAYGAVLGAFKSRLAGKPVGKSSLGYELAVLLSDIPFIFVASIKNITLKIFRINNFKVQF